MNENQPINTYQDFWQDTVNCWQKLPNKDFFFILLVAWLVLFQFLGNSILGYVHTPSLFEWMGNSYREGPAADDEHGWFIPFLVVGIFWWKRHELLESKLQLWLPGLFILLFGILLHILAYTIQEPHFSILALFIGIYGIMGMAWGREWLAKSFFPFFLFIFSVPLGTHGQFITFPLRQLVAWLVAAAAHVIGIDVIRVGTQLFDPSGSYQYEVAAACSGIRSLVVIFLIATVMGFLMFRSLWVRLFFMFLAFPLAVLGNFLRLFLVIFTAAIGGQKWGNIVHENFFTSLMPYIPAFVGLFAIARWLEIRQEKAEKS